ncbi:MAG: hypothetical protein KA105_02665 [Caulobacter sp.]|nr:hypothetical protein [Caulobacter sp.]
MITEAMIVRCTRDGRIQFAQQAKQSGRSETWCRDWVGIARACQLAARPAEETRPKRRRRDANPNGGRVSRIDQAIEALLAVGPVSAKIVADARGLRRRSVGVRLRKMVADGRLVKVGGGLWALPSMDVAA